MSPPWQLLVTDGPLSCLEMPASLIRSVFFPHSNLSDVIFIYYRTSLLKLESSLYYMQVVELDFLYPSEGIHRRWDSGYRITATAATWDQAALILSIPRRKPTDETQETLRTSAFPSQHVKVPC
jgi:hypothetical protein